MIAAVVSHQPSPLWYATRGAGAATLTLLTGSIVLGIAEVAAWRPVGVTRFTVASLHRSLSLLAIALLAVHVVTTLLDPFPHIGLVTAAIPFASTYRPLWLGLGTVASDLLIALIVTSLVRRRLGYRAWRGLHWLAYLCWPVALVHGLGTGSDARSTWMLVLTLACVAAVLAALAGRLASGRVTARARMLVTGAASVGALALPLWLAEGPLASGWARRAGTPAGVLAAFAPTSHRPVPSPATRPADPFARPFSASLSGARRSGLTRQGLAVVDLRLRLRGGPRGVLRLRIGGQALAGGGVSMDRSAVTLGPRSRPGEYQGRIDQLRGTTLSALVGSGDGRAVRLHVDLALVGNAVRGTLRSVPVGGGG